MSKLIIRAEILSAITNLYSNSISDSKELTECILELCKIEDKKTACDILVKEFLRTANEGKLNIIAYLLAEVIPEDVLLERFKNILVSPSVADEIKFKLITILKSTGIAFTYEDYEKFLQNPDALINRDTNILLSDSVSNPEIQIDFLDFLVSLPESDGELLIDSFVEDYEGDLLVNLIYPILFSMPETKYFYKILDVLGHTKSQKAVEVLNQLNLYYDGSEQIKKAIRKSLNLLKLSVPAQETVLGDYFDSDIFECYASMPDGHANQGLIFSRIRKNGTLQMFATVINLSQGVVDSFGFNSISINEFTRIVSKFYANQERIQVPPVLIKALLQEAEEKTLKQKAKISYEYICWKVILSDVDVLIDSVDTFLSYNLTQRGLLESDLPELSGLDFLNSWYFDEYVNDEFGDLIKEFCTRQENIKEFINPLTEKFIEKVWAGDELLFLNKKLLMCSYILKIQGKDSLSSLLYTLIEPSESKTTLLEYIAKKSIYEYFLRQKEQSNQKIIGKNIFTSRQTADKTLFSRESITNIIEFIESEWIGNE